MRFDPARGVSRKLVVAAAALLLLGGAALAQSTVAALDWTVDGNFKGKTARNELSAAACAPIPAAPHVRSCLIVNDEEKYAQFFSAEGTEIKPGKAIKLVKNGSDPDAEAATYDPQGGFFYVSGSHGRGRHHPDEPNDSSYEVFRFAVDPATGLPSFGFTEDEVPSAVQSTNKLRQIMETTEPLVAFTDKPLDQNGANIEGMAFRDGRLWFGFRGPVIESGGEDHAILLSANADGLFGSADPDAKTFTVKLGKGMGIRDLAAARDGLLLLSGPVADVPGPAAVYFWDMQSETPVKLFDVTELPEGAKPETVLLLGEDAQGYDVLVMLEKVANGMPREYHVAR